MILNKKQEEGLMTVIDRYRRGEKFTVIGGYAGTGKSTLVKFIVSALAAEGVIPDKDVVYTAYTGKACNVLQKMGNKNVSTLHKLLFEARPLPNGKFYFVPKNGIEYKIIIVDEVSMVPLDMAKRLLEHNNIYVIFCGDPGQLPPISKNQDNHLLDRPHVFLDEIQRQSAESGIIQLSMKIRNGERIDNFKSGDALVLPRQQLNTGMLTWGDIVLCATNNIRISLNQEIRNLKGFEKPIEEGDKLICLSNYWEDIGNGGSGCALTNGTIGTIKNLINQTFYPPRYLKLENIPILTCDFTSEMGEIYKGLDMDRHLIVNGESFLTPQQQYKLKQDKRSKDLVPYEFTYGYCVTTWKAQGSSWGKVLGIEEKFPYNREEHKRFLYTMCTRAEEKFVLIRN